MTTITKTYQIKASPAQVFDAMTNAETIQKWSGRPAEMDSQVGTKFSLFGGNILGSNLEVVPGQKLVQEWYESKWDHRSKVTLTLLPANGGTTVELLHEDVPEGEHEYISTGWEKYYLDLIQEMFEN